MTNEQKIDEILTNNGILFKAGLTEKEIPMPRIIAAMRDYAIWYNDQHTIIIKRRKG